MGEEMAAPLDKLLAGLASREIQPAPPAPRREASVSTRSGSAALAA